MSREMNRRAVLAGTAALVPAAALAAAPALAQPDPAFALIEAHRQATAQLNVATEDTEMERLDAVCAAEDQFVLTPPTTNLGVAAILRYIVEHEDQSGGSLYEYTGEFEDEDGEVFNFRNALNLGLSDTLERLAGRSIEPRRLTKIETDEDDEADEDQVAQEPPPPRTPEERIADFRELARHFEKAARAIEDGLAPAMRAAS